MPDDTPFFIVGSGRCGSTLLRLILAGHSRIQIPPETWFIGDLVRELPLWGPISAAQVDRAVDIMTGHFRWPDMQIPAEEFRRSASALAAPRLVDVINLVYQHHLRVHGKQRFGDKTPPYFEIIPELSVLYPGAKFIHLIRDGRDVAISFIENEYSERYYQRRFDWRRAMRFRRHNNASAHGGRILEVRYEDLVTNLERTVRQICEYLGEEFEPGMLDWHGRADLVPERGRQTLHKGLAEPLQTERIGTWRRKLRPFECFAMEACLQNDLRALGYQLRFAGAAWRPLLVSFGWLLFASAPLLARGIPYLQRRNYLPKRMYL